MSTGIRDGTRPPGTAGPDVGVGPPRRKRHWPLIVAVVVGVLLVAALITGGGLGAAYQPVGLGDSAGGLVGHMTTRQVNNFSPETGQTYLPPQKPASGGLYVSLANTGSYSVTIESASLNPPDAQGSEDRAAQPLRDSGTATYWPATGAHNGPGRRLAGLVLRPGQYILIRLPVTTAGCWMGSDSYVILNTFWVTTRFLSWTKQIRVWWTDPSNQDEGAILSQEPEPASQGGFCPR